MSEMHTLARGPDGLEWSSGPPGGGSNAMLPAHALTGSINSASGGINTTNASSSSSQPPPPSSVTSFFTSPLASVGVEYGRTLLANNSVVSSGGIGGWLRGSRLKYYFLIDQMYIRKKLMKLIVPYIYYDWARVKLDETDEGLVATAAQTNANPSATYKQPRHDLNAPDLYIGLMGFLTFIVTMGLALGMSDSFEPDMIGFTATRSLVCLIFEVGLIFLAFYLSDAPVTPSLLDLTALCAYKYVALNVDLVVGIIAGPTVFYIVWAVLGLSTIVFMVRTLNGWCPSSANALGSTPSSPRFRMGFIGFALIQLLFSLFLLYPALGTIHAHGGSVANALATWTTSRPSETEQSLVKPMTIHENTPSSLKDASHQAQSERIDTPTPADVTPVTSSEEPSESNPAATPVTSSEPAETPVGVDTPPAASQYPIEEATPAAPATTPPPESIPPSSTNPTTKLKKKRRTPKKQP